MKGKKETKKCRLFIDMDGTLAVFKYATGKELRTPGYFAALEPLQNVLDAVRILESSGEFEEIFSLSACLAGTNAIVEKNEWIDRYLPEIDPAHRIFSLCGSNKSAYIPGGTKETDILLDDFSVNLHDWHRAGGVGVKLLNGINGRFGSWKGSAVSFNHNPAEIATELIKIKKTICA